MKIALVESSVITVQEKKAIIVLNTCCPKEMKCIPLWITEPV